MNFSQWQIEMERAMAWSLLVGAISTALFIWIAYEVLKAAIRNGIDESKMGRAPIAKQPSAPPGYRWVLVKDEHPTGEIRAER